MECQCCQKKPAQVRVCDIEENAVSGQFNICPDCWIFAKRYLFDGARALVPTTEVIEEIRRLLQAKDPGGLALANPPGELAPLGKAEDIPVCPECGMTLSEFKQKGRFGCARDYEVFGPHLEKLLERVHDTTPPRHKGRSPQPSESGEAVVLQGLEMSTLREKLSQAVTLENYELAAQLRDQINELEKHKPAAGK
jgi:protein-arginine kinase activator protein McsA